MYAFQVISFQFKHFIHPSKGNLREASSQTQVHTIKSQVTHKNIQIWQFLKELKYTRINGSGQSIADQLQSIYTQVNRPFLVLWLFPSLIAAGIKPYLLDSSTDDVAAFWVRKYLIYYVNYIHAWFDLFHLKQWYIHVLHSLKSSSKVSGKVIRKWSCNKLVLSR